MQDRSIEELKSVVVDAINDGYGRWVSDFRVLDTPRRTYYLKISADSNNPSSMESIQYFMDYLEPMREDMNRNLAERLETPPYIRNLQVFDITAEQAIAMSKDPNYLYLSYVFDSIEEEMPEWNSAIHKLIVIHYDLDSESKKRKRNDVSDYPLKLARTGGKTAKNSKKEKKEKTVKGGKKEKKEKKDKTVRGGKKEKKEKKESRAKKTK